MTNAVYIYMEGGTVGKTRLTGTMVGVDVTASEKLWRSFQAVGDIAFSFAYSIVLVEIQACIYFYFYNNIFYHPISVVFIFVYEFALNF